jgi:transaldolase/glucose-6-phosphate isomerase
MTSGNRLIELHSLGQSVWLDSFRRGWALSGEFKRMIDEDGILGATTNPTIFQHAISGSTDYDDTIRRMVDEGKNAHEIYQAVMVEDVQLAADILRPIYDATDGIDGMVSIELPPAFAYDDEASIDMARTYHALVDRKNVMIKVPGTLQGTMAIERLIAEGINVNVTLLFSIEAYERAARAYMLGLQSRLDRGLDVSRVSSVASFFVSRIDTFVDHQLETLIAAETNSDKRTKLESLVGKTAIANAKMAYLRFRELCSQPGWKSLADRGARVQRLLWASTGTKNPKFKDTYYIDELIGPDTVNTMPVPTLFAFKNHGTLHATLTESPAQAEEVLKSISDAGIDLNAVAEQLEEEGVKSFQKSEDDLLDCLSAQQAAISGDLTPSQVLRIGDYQARVDFALGAMTEQSFARRLWQKDASIWKQVGDGAAVIKNRLGWLDVIETMQERLYGIDQFVEEVSKDGFTHVVLMGMGGSSLSPEVSRITFGVAPCYPDLMVLDSTVPQAVIDVERRIDMAHTLFIVATKSGTTVETLSAYKYFWEKVKAVKGNAVGENFVAITDPESALEVEARTCNFRRVFVNFADIGGRYSALSYFGILPLALIGADADKFLMRAARMKECSLPCVNPQDNPGFVLGTVMAELAMEGRNKLTLVMEPQLQAFGAWIEQLVAESTGKIGMGILPIDGESVADPPLYSDDRFFVYTSLASHPNPKLDERVSALEASGLPVVRIALTDIYDLGQEYYRWEMATAVASALMGVNAFDEPNVKESKDNTNRLIDEYTRTGSLPNQPALVEENGIKLFATQEAKATLDEIRSSGVFPETSIRSYLAAHLSQFQPGGYFALMAFLEMAPETDVKLQSIRERLRDAYEAAVTIGYGPRFLHSTGQLHKGGPNSGIFLEFTADDALDIAIPGAPYSFSVLKQCQALGDATALADKGRALLRIHLGADACAGLARILSIIDEIIDELQREAG